MYLDWIKCECSEDYGPCEEHCTVLVSREGAACYTADELCALFINDVQAIVQPTPGVPSMFSTDYANATEVANRYWEEVGSGWAEDETLSEELSMAATDMEQWLSDGVQAYWEDGYIIVQVADDCPLNFESEEEFYVAAYPAMTRVWPIGSKFTTEHFRGIALRVTGYRHETRVVAVMVGDDREHEIDTLDMLSLSEEDYCSECGQIGCTADGRDQ